MKMHLRLGLVTGVLALALVPAMAVAGGPSYHPAPEPDYTPAPGPPSHAKAYGKRCQGFSKRHVKGEQGTPFSRCVKAMAQADRDPKLTPREACKGLSKKHKGEEGSRKHRSHHRAAHRKGGHTHSKANKGTPFSRCVKAVAQMRKEQAS